MGRCSKKPIPVWFNFIMCRCGRMFFFLCLEIGLLPKAITFQYYHRWFGVLLKQHLFLNQRYIPTKCDKNQTLSKIPSLISTVERVKLYHNLTIFIFLLFSTLLFIFACYYLSTYYFLLLQHFSLLYHYLRFKICMSSII